MKEIEKLVSYPGCVSQTPAKRFQTRRTIAQNLLEKNSMGPLQLAVTWYKIHHAGEQATHWDIQNKENANLS